MAASEDEQRPAELVQEERPGFFSKVLRAPRRVATPAFA